MFFFSLRFDTYRKCTFFFFFLPYGFPQLLFVYCFIIFSLVYVCPYASVCSVYIPGAHGGQKEVLECLERKLQAVGCKLP